MKRIFVFLAVAAMMVVACDKNSKTGGDPSDYNYTSPKVEAPVNKENHFGFSVDASAQQDNMKNPAGQADKVKEGSIPPNSPGVVVFENAGPKEFNFTTLDGKVSGGAVFVGDIFERLEVVSLDGKNAVLKATVGGKEVTLPAGIMPEPAYTPFRQDVCRNWEIEETIVAVKGSNIPSELGVGKKFTGCKISEISAYLVEKGVKIKPVGPDYDVTSILIDPAGKFGIFFVGKNPYYGDYTLKGTEFSYEFTYYENSNPILAGNAKGALSISNGFGRLQVKGDVKDSSANKYSVDLIFKMKTFKPLVLAN